MLKKIHLSNLLEVLEQDWFVGYLKVFSTFFLLCILFCLIFSALDATMVKIAKINTQTQNEYYAGTYDGVTITMLFSHDSNNFQKCTTNSLWNPDDDLLQAVG